LDSVTTDPMIHYFHSAGTWHNGELSAAEVEALEAQPAVPVFDVHHWTPYDALETAIAEALRSNGRMGHEQLARQVQASEPVVRRRLSPGCPSGQEDVRPRHLEQPRERAGPRTRGMREVDGAAVIKNSTASVPRST
jgi:hypothetical protein